VRRTGNRSGLDQVQVLDQQVAAARLVAEQGDDVFRACASTAVPWASRAPVTACVWTDSLDRLKLHHAEHQLGFAIDFSTPYMEGLYQNLFHTNFYYTVEGQWLNENAAKFGFTLSFPLGVSTKPAMLGALALSLCRRRPGQELVDRH